MQTKAPKQRVDGVLLLDKAEGISSNHALQQVKRLYSAEKAGHTGTLDPFASGLLPICFGEATKFSAFALDADKRYEATLALGATTTTGDREGEVLERRSVSLDADRIERALARLRGDIMQTPPMYSALKKNGKPLYQYARAGIEVERDARQVHIYALETCAWRGAELDIQVTCSKGTYIRTLAEQIGAELGCGAHLSRLRRSASGPWVLDAALDFEQLSALDEPARMGRLLPCDVLAGALPKLALDAGQALLLAQGRTLPYAADWPLARAYLNERFVGIVAADGGRLRVQRWMSPAAGQATRALEADAI